VDPSGEPRDAEPLPGAVAATELASLTRDGLDIWSSQARRWYDRSKERRTWSPEDVVSDYNDLIESFTPLVEKSINVMLGLLRAQPPDGPPPAR
jgi:hypothetical protein